MSPELKAKWVAALRSGQYKQGTYTMRATTDHYCCLGVLCDVSGAGEWCLGNNIYHYSYKVGDTKESITLPTTMKTSLGLEQGKVGELIDMNDRKRMTFAEIADHIEANL